MPSLDDYLTQNKINKRLYFYGVVQTISFVFWIVPVMHLRDWVENKSILYFLGFIPNLFAATFLFFLISRKRKGSDWINAIIPNDYYLALLVFIVFFIGELIQGYLLNKIYDNLDLLASAVGVVLSIFIKKIIHLKVPPQKEDLA